MGMIELRNSMIASQPHTEEKSGSFVNFSTDMAVPLEITGSGSVTITGKNLWNEDYTGISSSVIYVPVFVGNNKATLSTTLIRNANDGCSLFLVPGNVSSGASSATHGVDANRFGSRTFDAVNGYVTVVFRNYAGHDPRTANTQLEIGSSATAYEQYKANTSSTLTGRKPYKGVNNIWSDNGSITVKYWTH